MTQLSKITPTIEHAFMERKRWMPEPKKNFRQLFKIGVAMLMRRGHCRQEAEDICQEALIRSNRGYDPKKGKYSTYFIVWLLGLGCNVYNKRIKRTEQAVDYNIHCKSNAQQASCHKEVITHKDEYTYLIRGLSAREKDILRKVAEGCNYQEIANVYSFTRQHIRQIALSALDKIRDKKHVRKRLETN